MSNETLTSEVGLPPHEVQRLLRVATGLEGPGLVLTATLTPPQEQRFRELSERRRRGEPLQYLEGTVQFGPVEVAVDRRVLIPRPETEYLLELAAEIVENPKTILDLGTGSGNLALALKHQYPAATVIASDSSPDAISVAQTNSARLGLEVETYEGDLFAPLPAGFRGELDLVVANPPYVSAGEFEELPAEIREHEPRHALVAGPLGTEILARIAAQVGSWLCSGGWVLCEIGETQAELVLRLFSEAGEAEIRHDLAGKPRYIMAQRP